MSVCGGGWEALLLCLLCNVGLTVTWLHAQGWGSAGGRPEPRPVTAGTGRDRKPKQGSCVGGAIVRRLFGGGVWDHGF